MPLPFLVSVQQKRAADLQELSAEHLEGFRKSQQVAYACCEAIEAELREGMTEVQVTGMMWAWLRDNGVREFFHMPFAWFGDRTALHFKKDAEFYPTSRVLEPGMPAIIDVAPIVDGHTSDVGYCCKLGENALHDQMLDDLEPYRQLILDGVRARRQMSEIYYDVNRLIQKQGYQNRHQRYSNRVLGHRVNFVPREKRSEKLLLGFGTPAVKYLFGRQLQRFRGKEHLSPFWNDRPSSDHLSEPGLWAVEPHLALRDTGVKWEELLVVTEDGAHWLDDNLPHVRRWQRRKQAAAQTQRGLEARA